MQQGEKNLGIIIDNKLKFKSHVKMFGRKFKRSELFLWTDYLNNSEKK